MKRLLPLLILLALPLYAISQTQFTRGWTIWCEHQQNNLQQTSDGGYILCTDAVPEMDTVNNLSWCYLIKLDAMGAQQWAVQFAKSSYFVKAFDGNSVVQTSDGGYAIATVMYTQTPSAQSSHTAIFVVKTNSMGGLLWSKTYPGIGNSSASCIKETANHDLIIAGNTVDTLVFQQDAYLLRLDSIGNVLWGKTYNRTGSSVGQFYTATETADSGFIVSGSLYSWGVAMKTDANGNVIWASQPNNTGSSELYDIAETSEGNYIACGRDYSVTGFRTLIKFDPAGNSIWHHSYAESNSPTSSGDVSYSVLEANGGYSASLSTPNYRAGIIHVDTAGQPVWTYRYNDTYTFHPIDLEHTTDQGYVMCVSYYDLFAATWDWKVCVLKTDSMGRAECHDTLVVDSAIVLPPTVPIPLNVASSTPAAPIPTVLHYVLLADTNFCFTDPKGFGEANSQVSVSLFPNPASDYFQFYLSGLTGNDVRIRVVNSVGQEMAAVKQENVSVSWTGKLATNTWAGGVYFVTFEIDGQFFRAEKLVIGR
jgi:hypothetical protein